MAHPTSYIKRDTKSVSSGRNLLLFLGFLSRRGYSVTAVDDYSLMYRIEKGAFLKFLCSTDFNSAECSRLLKDKTLTYLALEHLGIGVPRGTYFIADDSADATPVEDVLGHLAQAAYPQVIKPNDSSLGKGITFLEGYDEARARKAIRRAKKRSRVILAQEYVPGQEFRIVAVEGEILIAIKKFRRPLPPEEIPPSGCAELTDLVADSMRAFGALVCGYDLIVGDGVKVLEVNSNPFVFQIEEYLSGVTMENYLLRLEQLLRRSDGY